MKRRRVKETKRRKDKETKRQRDEETKSLREEERKRAREKKKNVLRTVGRLLLLISPPLSPKNSSKRQNRGGQ